MMHYIRRLLGKGEIPCETVVSRELPICGSSVPPGRGHRRPPLIHLFEPQMCGDRGYEFVSEARACEDNRGILAIQRPMLAASAAARCMLVDISLVTVLCSSTAAAVDVTYSLTS